MKFLLIPKDFNKIDVPFSWKGEHILLTNRVIKLLIVPSIISMFFDIDNKLLNEAENGHKNHLISEKETRKALQRKLNKLENDICLKWKDIKYRYQFHAAKFLYHWIAI